MAQRPAWHPDEALTPFAFHFRSPAAWLAMLSLLCWVGAFALAGCAGVDAEPGSSDGEFGATASAAKGGCTSNTKDARYSARLISVLDPVLRQAFYGRDAAPPLTLTEVQASLADAQSQAAGDLGGYQYVMRSAGVVQIKAVDLQSDPPRLTYVGLGQSTVTKTVNVPPDTLVAKVGSSVGSEWIRQRLQNQLDYPEDLPALWGVYELVRRILTQPKTQEKWSNPQYNVIKGYERLLGGDPDNASLGAKRVANLDRFYDSVIQNSLSAQREVSLEQIKRLLWLVYDATGEDLVRTGLLIQLTDNLPVEKDENWTLSTRFWSDVDRAQPGVRFLGVRMTHKQRNQFNPPLDVDFYGRTVAWTTGVMGLLDMEPRLQGAMASLPASHDLSLYTYVNTDTHTNEETKALLAFKSSAQPEIATIAPLIDREQSRIADLVGAIRQRFADTEPVFVPVPNSDEPQTTRMIAQYMAEQTGLTVVPLLKSRGRKQESRALSLIGRMYRMATDPPFEVDKKQVVNGPVILVDDVATTEVTQTYATHLAIAHGATSVWRLSLFKTIPPAPLTPPWVD